MRCKKISFFLCLLLLWGIAILPSYVLAKSTVHVLKLEGIINPVSAKFIIEELEKANDDRSAECFIIEMDTPGGLMDSMREIIKEILASKIPVVVYVYPSGSRAASAGVFIMYASHIAAMTPGTNVGAASPVAMQGQMDSVMSSKVTNDAVAYIKSLAERRKRNAEWAEEAVRKAVSITEKEALELNVIDYIAMNLDSLLLKIDGEEIDVDGEIVTLNTKDASVVTVEMNWRFRILDRISDPNIFYILMMIALWGIFFELSNPGAIFPGVVGAIALILVLFGVNVLPINYAGILLIVLAVILFLLEIKITSYGLLSIGGVLSMLLGSLMLFDTAEPIFRVSLKIIIPSVLATLLLFIVAISLAIRAQRRKVTTGSQGIVGETGITIEKLAPEGKIKIHGEIWNATAEKTIQPKQKVKVVKIIEGLLLYVEPLKK